MFNDGNTASTGYTIANSLRLRSSASAYLSRTPASAGNRRTFTWSGWIKRGALDVDATIFGTSDSISSGYNTTSWRFTSTGALRFLTASNTGASVIQFDTTAVFRDPSAWYSVILYVDTVQATNTNGVRIYVNGVNQAGTYVAYTQNTDNFFNSTLAHYIGRWGSISPTHYFDGYLSDVYFIDGQALDPSYFGTTNSDGVWVPKAYTGTYGTNGFYLPFNDGSNLTNLCLDRSGNGNNWTATNVSLTAGSTYDWMVDTPTNNYAVLNPLYKDGAITSFADGNLKVTGPANPAGATTGSIFSSAGLTYLEFSVGANFVQVGVIDSAISPMGGVAQMIGAGKVTWDTNTVSPALYVNSSSGSGYTSLISSDIGMIAFDASTRKVWFGKNGTWLASGNPATGANPAGTVSGSSGALMFAVRAESTSCTVNFGQRPFTFSAPTGFKPLCTANLP